MTPKEHKQLTAIANLFDELGENCKRLSLQPENQSMSAFYRGEAAAYKNAAQSLRDGLPLPEKSQEEFDAEMKAWL